MSASIDQGSKTPQVQTGTNGPTPGKEAVKDIGYENYMRQPHQAANMSNPERFVTPNFYALSGFPYFGDPAWSSGGDYLGYGQPSNEYMPGSAMLNAFDYSHGALPWSNFPQMSADFAWGAAAANGRKEMLADQSVYDYYAVSSVYAPVNGDMDMEMRALEHGLQGVGVSDEAELPHERGHAATVPDGSVDARAVNSNDSSVASVAGNSSAANCVASAAAAAPVPPVKKPMSWASVASQPAKSPQQQQLQHPRANRHVPPTHVSAATAGAGVGDANSWDRDEAAVSGPDGAKGCRQISGHVRQSQLMMQQQQQQQAPWAVPRAARGAGQQHGIACNSSDPGLSSGDSSAAASGSAAASAVAAAAATHPVLEKLKSANMYNPVNFDLNPKSPRFFIIKSYSEDDIHRSIKYNIWCSTDHGNKRLDAAFLERAGKGPVYLFFSVNGSGHFCGMAQMMSAVDYNSHSGVWTQDKWKGQFEVKWIYVKDVPNGQLRHIRLENNENKPVTNSRDTQEVPPEKGKQVLKIMHGYRHTTSIFDDFGHYEKKQEEDESKKRAVPVGDY